MSFPQILYSIGYCSGLYLGQRYGYTIHQNLLSYSTYGISYNRFLSPWLKSNSILGESEFFKTTGACFLLCLNVYCPIPFIPISITLLPFSITKDYPHYFNSVSTKQFGDIGNKSDKNIIENTINSNSNGVNNVNDIRINSIKNNIISAKEEDDEILKQNNIKTISFWDALFKYKRN